MKKMADAGYRIVCDPELRICAALIVFIVILDKVIR